MFDFDLASMTTNQWLAIGFLVLCFLLIVGAVFVVVMSVKQTRAYTRETLPDLFDPTEEVEEEPEEDEGPVESVFSLGGDDDEDTGDREARELLRDAQAVKESAPATRRSRRLLGGK